MAELLAAHDAPHESPTTLDPTSDAAKSLEHFRKARRTVLTQQMRASEDPTFQKYLQQLRDATANTAVPAALVQALEPLSSTDIRRNPKLAFATIAVLGNYERHRLNALQIKNGHKNTRFL